MQAQRKFEQPTPAVENADGWSPPLASGPADAVPSPAHLLWEELAARLQQGQPRVLPSSATATATWPMPGRIAIVVGLSSLCWVGIYLVVANIL